MEVDFMRKCSIMFMLVTSVLLSAQVKVIANRGASRLAPENTVASAQLAYQLNADAVEVDVYLSVDDEVMVNHDKNTYRTSAGKTDYVLSETRSDLLNSVDVGAWKSLKYKGEKLPYLRDILALVPEGKRLVIEIKCGSEIIPALKQVLDESGKIAQCDFISSSWETIQQVHIEFPQNPCFYLKMYPWGLEKKMREVAEIGLSGVNLYYKIINKRRMALAQDLGVDVWCWTVDKPRDFVKMKKLGLVAITTNCPSLFTYSDFRLPSAQ